MAVLRERIKELTLDVSASLSYYTLFDILATPTRIMGRLIPSGNNLAGNKHFIKVTVFMIIF